MAYDFQVAIDSSASSVLADWWAEGLGWQVEPQDAAFIRRMVDARDATEAETTRHRGALVWRAGAAITSPEPGRPRVPFQEVPETKTVKYRLRLDVRVGANVRRRRWPGCSSSAPPNSGGERRGRTPG